MALATRLRSAGGGAEPLQFDLPHDGLRLHIRATGNKIADTIWLGTMIVTIIVTAAAAIAAAGMVGAAASLLFAAIVARIAVRYGYRQYGPGAVVTIDRAGIHDCAGGLPVLTWDDIIQLEPVETIGEGLCLYARLTEAANLRRFGIWRWPLRLALSASARNGVLLTGTSAVRLPVPLEYLILQLEARGAPIRPAAAHFDPFECDARWLPPARAAAAVTGRLGRRARPYCAHHLDLAHTRGDDPAATHWRSVIGELRKIAGEPMDAAPDAEIA